MEDQANTVIYDLPFAECLMPAFMCYDPDPSTDSTLSISSVRLYEVWLLIKYTLADLDFALLLR